jgi:hypothetical protein
LLLEQIDQIGSGPHAHESLHGVEDDIKFSLGHTRGPTYETEPLNLSVFWAATVQKNSHDDARTIVAAGRSLLAAGLF